MNVDVVLFCSRSSITWLRLLAGLSIIDEAQNETVEIIASQTLVALQTIARLWRHYCATEDPRSTEHRAPSSDQDGMLALVKQFAGYECSDPRDRIYALYNLATDVVDTSSTRSFVIPMAIDYSSSTRQLYRKFATACIKTKKTSQILEAALSRQCSEYPLGWPSWVPDWRLPITTTHHHLDPASIEHVHNGRDEMPVRVQDDVLTISLYKFRGKSTQESPYGVVNFPEVATVYACKDIDSCLSALHAISKIGSCCTLTGLSLHSLILHIYIAPFVHSYLINLVLYSPSITHT